MARALLACMFLGACTPLPGPVAAAAQNDLACAWVDVREAYVTATWMKAATGCGKETLYVANSEGRYVSPLDRAEGDLDCEKKELKAARLGPGQVGVWGCGRRATYVVRDHEWVVYLPVGG